MESSVVVVAAVITIGLVVVLVALVTMRVYVQSTCQLL